MFFVWLTMAMISQEGVCLASPGHHPTFNRWTSHWYYTKIRLYNRNGQLMITNMQFVCGLSDLQSATDFLHWKHWRLMPTDQIMMKENFSGLAYTVTVGSQIWYGLCHLAQDLGEAGWGGLYGSSSSPLAFLTRLFDYRNKPCHRPTTN